MKLKGRAGAEMQKWKMKLKKCNSACWFNKRLTVHSLCVNSSCSVLLTQMSCYRQLISVRVLPCFASRSGFSEILIAFITQVICPSYMLGTRMCFCFYKFWAPYKYLTEREKCQSILKIVCLWNTYFLKTPLQVNKL